MADGLIPPYEDGNYSQISVTRPVNLVQFSAEIQQATGTEVVLSLAGPSSPEPVSDSNPATLYVCPQMDDATIGPLLAEHVPNALWRSLPRERAFQEVWAKLLDNPDHKMTAAEQRALVVGMAFRMMT